MKLIIALVNVLFLINSFMLFVGIQHLSIFLNGSLTFFEGDSVSLQCQNFNRAQQYIGDGVWTNSNGTVLGKRNLEFTATRELAGVYTCSLPMTPVDISSSYDVIVYCKCFNIKM